MPLTPARATRSRRHWKRRMRVAGAWVWSAVEGLTAPGARPERSESEVSTLVAVVTLAAGALFLLIMMITWLTRS
ncbi:hypothetical protein AB0F72_33315 [Actinoplanes sp. NPDC023936]|uniref:hypothetical protein n=1 Tax=Actinoplanes sp. NPDC023936 TaxID=3154910 RepID=UPI00340CA083